MCLCFCVSIPLHAKKREIGETILPKSDQDLLHGVVSVPLSDAGKLGEVDSSILLVDAGKVDLGGELNDRRLVGIASAAVDLEVVDAVLMDTLEGHADERSATTQPRTSAQVWWVSRT